MRRMNYNQFKYYKGGRYTYPPDDNYLKRGWWYLEKGYTESNLVDKMPIYQFFSFENTLEQYKYFRGESRCPYQYEDSEVQWQKERWWKLEKNHWNHHQESGPFIEFFRHWMYDHALANSCGDINDPNDWMKEYVNFSECAMELLSSSWRAL